MTFSQQFKADLPVAGHFDLHIYLQYFFKQFQFLFLFV